MTWVLIIVGPWLLAAVLTALLIGRTVHTADVLELAEEQPGGPGARPGPAGGRGAHEPPARRALADR